MRATTKNQEDWVRGICMIQNCLSQSRFIAFFDECGDHSLSKIDKDFPLFLLSTVVVERQAYAQEIVPALAAFKLRYFAHEGINLHSREIRKAEGPFAIHKTAYAQRHGAAAKNPYDLALEYSFERILHFLEEQHENQLPVIAEARGQQEDNALRAGFQRLMTLGTDYNQAERFQKLVCPISFRRKQDNIAGIQLADLCAHPTARHLLHPGIGNQAFDVVQLHLYVSGRVNGLKVYPK
jgi:Protein of unknown function (DUF3800)